MAEFKYLEKQEKIIEKKKAELEDKTKNLLHESKMNRIKEKYDTLVKKKKSGKSNLEDEILLGIYKDTIEIEEKENK
ncbi:MAG: hypothetical protein A4E26_01653 [Methanobacterium sp. PtaU1.Bin097]|jgi:hypothetical protein|nr:MAG: hypothetical protein A4E26_01653 [Methanobacterium sp. PtaU1.Bin097]